MNEASARCLAREIPRGACLAPDMMTGGQPPEAFFQQLADLGFRTVLDLRRPDEPRGFDERATVEACGLAYINVPVDQHSARDEEYDAIRAVLSDASHRPILVHCAAANRAGAAVLPYLLLDEKRDDEEAFDLACAVGLRNAGLAESAMDYAARHKST